MHHAHFHTITVTIFLHICLLHQSEVLGVGDQGPRLATPHAQGPVVGVLEGLKHGQLLPQCLLLTLSGWYFDITLGKVSLLG